MYKIFPEKALAYVISLLTVGVLLLVEFTTHAFGIKIKMLAVPGIVWLLLVGLAFNPIWRFLWRWSAKLPLIPDFNKVIFPDLNGTWTMRLESNWSRQEQLLESALGHSRSLDMLNCDAQELAPLKEMKLQAEIEQSWWSIKITVTNPKGDSPIKESKTYMVNPSRKTDRMPASLCYFYDQTNETDNVADDPVFNAAACLIYNEKANALEGTFWTTRMWRRAVNTAGRIVLSRGE
jgi:hypothetical protein